MKKQLFLLFLLCSPFAFGQRSAIGTTTPDASAAYEIRSTTKGFLPPRMTQAERDAIPSPASGLLIFNTTVNCEEFYNGTTWFSLCQGGPNFKITTQPTAPTPTCPGSGIQTLSVVASKAGLTYTWRKNGVALVNGGVVSGQGTTTLTLTNPQLSDAGNYEVVVSDGSWSVVSYNVPVVVYDTSIAYVSGEQTTLSTTYTLTAYAPSATINWYATPTGGTALATGTRYTLPSNTAKITYYVDATVGGCTTPTRTPVTVSAPLVIGAAGKTWMTYNLGATNVAKSYNDYTQYGSLYQWGRGSDGHELMNWTSATTGTQINGYTTIQATTYNPGHSDFISKSIWLTPENVTLWQGVNGLNNPCPSGFRVPTQTEWNDELTAAGITNVTSAYNSALKLVAAGVRFTVNNGQPTNSGNNMWYWTSTVSTSNASYYMYNGYQSTNDDFRGSGKSVRCIKD